MVPFTRMGFCTLSNLISVLTKSNFNYPKIQCRLFRSSSFLSGPGMEIVMPSLSPTMNEGKIIKWLKKEGDVVIPGDVLCDIETDKAVISMETEEEGILAKILVPENTGQIKVGSLIALMVSEKDDWKNVDVPEGASFSDSSNGRSSSNTSSSRPSTITVTMPSLSPTMTSGTIVKWLKKEGNSVSPGDVLCDIQTDKAVMSLETEEEGILAKILVRDDSNDVKVGTPIALIVAEDDDWKSVNLSSSAQSKTLQPQSVTNSTNGSSDARSKRYGPAVRALLDTYQIGPGLIKPSGRNNRLLKEDVLKYIGDNKLERKPPKIISTSQVQTKPKETKSHEEKKLSQQNILPKYEDIELTNARKVIAKRLTQSKREIPHSYSIVKCNVGNLLEAKNKLSAEGLKISINDLLTKSTALALQMYPKANMLYVNNEVKPSSSIDVCVAVATKSGLYTPIIKSTNSKSLEEISKEIKELATKAKDGKLKPDEFMGGTFTISNLGMFGITHFKAIINPPQCGILAVGDTVSTLDPDFKIQKHMTLSLSYDRRAMDEYEAAEFMETLKHVIENPKLVLAGNHRSSMMGL